MIGTPPMHPSGACLGNGQIQTEWTNASGVPADTQTKALGKTSYVQYRKKKDDLYCKQKTHLVSHALFNPCKEITFMV